MCSRLCDVELYLLLHQVEQVLKDAKVKKNEIDDIVLVGGSTRIPKVRAMLEEFFGGKKVSRQCFAEGLSSLVYYGFHLC